MEDIKPLTSKELCISGFFGHQIIDTFNKKCLEKKKQGTLVIYEFDGYEIYLKNNYLDFFGFFDKVAEERILNNFNVYINNKINSIEDPSLKQKTITIANLELSRKSKYHIFNIELLTKTAAYKPDCFMMFYYIMQEKEYYEAAKDDYMYYMFAIFDADTKELAGEIYDAIAEEIFPDGDEEHYRQVNRNASLEKVKDEITSYDAKFLQKINDNIRLIKSDN